MNNAKFFPVIRAQSLLIPHSIDDIIRNYKVSVNSGADGIVLIPDYCNTQASSEDLFEQYLALKTLNPNFPVGVNFLRKFKEMPTNLIEKIISTKFDMIQSDWAFTNQLPFAEMKTTFYSALAFKYSKHEDARGEDLQKLCQQIPSLKNVVPTTSGKRTGEAADINKIIEIRRYLNSEQRLGIASGITAANVSAFKDAGVTDYLVATSILSEKTDPHGFDNFDPSKTKELADLIHN